MHDYKLELYKEANLAPVTYDELVTSVFQAIKTSEITHQSMLGTVECAITSGETEPESIQEAMAYIEDTSLWKISYPMWNYAENGKFMGLPYHADDVVRDMIVWLMSIKPITCFDGENFPRLLIKVLFKFLARLKIDFNIDLDSEGTSQLFGSDHGIAAFEHGWLPQLSPRDITVLEIALLAGVSNIRTVRNAQHNAEKPLNYRKNGRQVLIELEEAKRWLASRRGYIPTDLNTINQ